MVRVDFVVVFSILLEEVFLWLPLFPPLFDFVVITAVISHTRPLTVFFFFQK